MDLSLCVIKTTSCLGSLSKDEEILTEPALRLL